MPKTIFDLCNPRDDVLKGRVRDEEFAADLSQVIQGTAPKEYCDAATFYGNTYPTKGLRLLLKTACSRLSGVGGELNSLIRLDTQFGGGKTHGLIALVHAAAGAKGVSNIAEFVDPALLPQSKVRVAPLDGENADPSNGLRLEDGINAYSLWGEMAYRLDGLRGYKRVQRSDETHTAPGAETIRELFGDEPCLIMLDEVAVYLRKAARAFPDGVNQFTAFAQALLKAVASTPNVCLVFTLAINRERESKDAYRDEQQLALSAFDEAESIAGRKATVLNPTEEDETAFVLRRRLFQTVDDARVKEIASAYQGIWQKNKDALHEDANRRETLEQFIQGYPLHPETLATLIEKTSSLTNFQRTRGMLRLLARTVHNLWQERPADAFAIHPHHINPAVQAIRDEVTTRLGQSSYTPALAADVAAHEGVAPSTAESIDAREYPGQPPVTSYLARTIFLNTIAYPDSAKGIAVERLRYAVCSPAIDPTFVDSARKRFIEESLYLDDRPGSPLRYMVEPNLNQMIRKAMDEVDSESVRAHAQERIRDTFAGQRQSFEPIFFPAGPYEVPDDIGDGRPYLVVLNYDASSVSAEPTDLPTDIVQMAKHKGVANDLRLLLNNIIFAVADAGLRESMKKAIRKHLGLRLLTQPDRIRELADYQQEEVKKLYRTSQLEVAVAVLRAYRHLFYPSQTPLGKGGAQLAHTVVELPNTSDDPGNGQRFIKRALADQKKILESGNAPDAPAFVRDQTPLRTKGEISTLELREEFRKAPKLSILLDEEPLTRCIREGINLDVFIYRQGDQVWGKNDPSPVIRIGDDAFVHTMADAKAKGLWPRKPKEPDRGTDDPGQKPTDTDKPPLEPPKPAPLPGAITAEGPLRSALTQIFEKSRDRKINAFDKMSIRMFGANEGWHLHQAIATLRGVDVNVFWEVRMSGKEVTDFQLSFDGSLNKSNSIKSFLQPQLAIADDQSFEGTYRLTFTEPLNTSASDADTFIKNMTKYGGGEAYVEATAASEQSK